MCAASPVERIQRRSDVGQLPDEDRRVALGVAARLAVSQAQHQAHEVGGLVALERGHELLVVDPERVRRVVVDPRNSSRPMRMCSSIARLRSSSDSAYQGRTFTNGYTTR